MTRKQRYASEDANQTTFEAIMTTLRPFAQSGSISSGKRAKLSIAVTVNADELASVVASAGERVTRNGNTVFVSFDDLSNEAAAAIVARVFGEAKSE